MSRIQSFEEFSKNFGAEMHMSPSGKMTNMDPSDDDYEINYGKPEEPITEATDKDKITKVTPQDGEVARWRVVLKKGSENIADNAVPQVIAELAKDKDFQDWWNTAAEVKDADSSTTQSAKGSQLIAFAHKIKEQDKNLFGKEVAKYEIGFRVYAVMMPNGKTYVNYDVAKAQPKGSIKVGDSGASLKVWSDEDIKTMKLQDKKEVGAADVYAETNPAVQSAISTAVSGNSGTTTTTTAAPTGSTQSATASTSASPYVGLKLNPKAADAKVKELQTKILALNNTASAKIKAVGGADGKYGKATATAIGILVGSNKEENEITQEIATKLDAELAKAPATAPATQTANTKPAAPKTKSQGSSTSTKTPGGKTVIF